VPELSGIVDAFVAGNGGAGSGPRELLASLLIAAFIGLAVAFIYQRTHHGLSYSRGFTQSLVVLTIAASLLIFVIGDSLVTAFGLLGALAIVRFRNVLKDTRDTVFVFIALVLGMATGTERYGVAFVGATVLLAVVVYLHAVSFGSKENYDGHVSYSIARGGALRADAAGPDWSGALAHVESVLSVFCHGVKRMTLHDSDELMEVVSAVRLRDPARGSEMVDHLRSVPGVEEASLVLRDSYAEL